MDKCPKVSILLPVRNEESSIEACLQAIFCQDYPQENVEVIVADGESTDKTCAILQRIQDFQPNLDLVNNPGRIVPTGLNVALVRASGDYIIRVDGHTQIAPDYVSQCVFALRQSGADNVGGRMNAECAAQFGQAVAQATSSPFGVGGARFHYSNGEEWVDTVYLGAWPRSVFERIGLFDEEMVRDQDDEFNYRLREAGGKILLSPKIRSLYTPRSTPLGLWKQYFQYGFWKVRVLQKHPLQMRPRQFIPPLFVLCLFLLALLSIAFPIAFFLLCFVSSAYILANFTASFLTAAKTGWRNVYLLPFVYTILHVSYGAGFLSGLVRFWNRWSDKEGKVPHLKQAHV